MADKVLINTPNEAIILAENDKPIIRDEMGRFIKGSSGNLHRKPSSYDEFRALAREHSVEAISKCIAIMRDGKAKNADTLKAIEIILNRAWGTAPLALTSNGGEGTEGAVLSIEALVRMVGGSR